MVNTYGIVSIFSASPTSFPRYALAEAAYDRPKSGYHAVGGFGVANNNGVILGPSLFLRARSKDKLSQKAALSWATDIKQWVRFVEVIQVGHKAPPYDFDLMAIDESTLKRYGDFLTRLTISKEGKRLTTATVRTKLMRVCFMYQWFADNGWYLGDLGGRAEQGNKRLSVRPMGFLAHIGQRKDKPTKLGPMGSAYAGASLRVAAKTCLGR